MMVDKDAKHTVYRNGKTSENFLLYYTLKIYIFLHILSFFFFFLHFCIQQVQNGMLNNIKSLLMDFLFKETFKKKEAFCSLN